MTTSTTGSPVPSATPSVTLAVPRRWAIFDDPAPGVALVARAPMPTPSGFTPELALHTGPVDAPTLTEWRHEAMAALAAQLDDLEVEDTDVVDLDGAPVGYTRFSHRIGGVDVVCDQWAWLSDGVGVTLTGTIARVDYADYADLFEQVAATVEISVRAPGSVRPAEARW
jgi:hypothetical protein